MTNWMLTEKELPPEPDDGIHLLYEMDEYIVTIEGASEATVLHYAGDGEWWRDGEFYRVTAWMPLPDAYHG